MPLPPAPPSQANQRRWGFARAGLLGLGLALVACQAQPNGRPSNAPRPNAPAQGLQASPQAQGPSQAAQAEQQASATAPSPSPAAVLRLPGRLGLALPPSLVGKGGQARLSGEAGGVAKENTNWVVLNDGRIVSNNSGALISDAGGGIVSNNSGALIGNNGGALISDHGSGRRVLAQASAQADRPATVAPNGYNEPRTFLWVTLAIIDFDDQLLEAFIQSGPRLGEWKRFSPKQLKYLPPPNAPADFVAGLDLAESVVRNLPFAGLVVQEGGALVLRVVQLPAPDAALPEGRMLIEMSSQGGLGAVVRSRLTAPLENFLGVASSSARIEVGQNAFGRVLHTDLNLRYAPPAERSPIGMVITGGLDQRASRNRVRIEHTATDRGHALMAGSQLHFLSGAFIAMTGWNSVGYRPAAMKDLGLAILTRGTAGPIDSLPPMMWSHPILGPSIGTGAPTPYYSPEDGVYATEASADLKALTPSFRPEDDDFIPPTPRAGEDPTTSESDLPATPSEAIYALPESP